MPSEGAVGRQSELTAVDAFLEAARSGLRALALTGPAGIGKTTVWREGVRRAREQGWLALTARPGGAEATLSFAGLADLLEPVERRALAALPRVQRQALDVALLRTEGDAGVDGRAVAAAVLSLLRELAAWSPVLVAVDDVQWLDAATADSLAFAVRRLEGEPVAVLVAERVDGGGRVETFERAAGSELRAELSIGPLSTAALHDIFKRRLGRIFPRPTLVRIASACGGNPFYALEIARELDRIGPDSLAGRLPLPGELRALVTKRLERLPASTRDALLVASCLAQPTLALADGDALIAAEEADVVHVDSQGRVRFTHPLLADAVYDSATAGRRRRAHRALAGVVDDPEERARHLALASTREDAGVADALEDAARRASRRGATPAAAELAELSVQLTPRARLDDRLRRGTLLGTFLYFAGDATAAIARLEQVLAEAPPGPARARVALELGFVYPAVGEHEKGAALLDEASAALDDRVLAAEAHARRAWISGLDLPAMLENAGAVLELIEEPEAPAVWSFALQHLAWARLLTGEAAEHRLIERSLAGQQEAEGWAISSVGPRWPIYFDDFETARTRHEQLLRRTEQSGNEVERQSVLVYLALLELWSGHPDEAHGVASESLELAEQIEQEPMACVSRYALGLTEVHRDRLDEALAFARGNLPLIGSPPHGPEFFLAAQTYAVLGSVAFCRNELAEADRWFTLADEAVERWAEPAPFRYHGDHVEALIALGELDRAEVLVRRLELRAERIPRPWLCAVAARSRGLLRSACHDPDGALAALERSLEEEAGPVAPAERARSLLTLGQLLRRRKERRAARGRLEEALRLFEEIGAPGWAERVRAELARVPVRRAPSELTPTELEIARLAATGLTNRVIAERVFVSPKTVEANLSRVYRKLEIHSRAELALAMAARQAAPSRSVYERRP